MPVLPPVISIVYFLCVANNLINLQFHIKISAKSKNRNITQLNKMIPNIQSAHWEHSKKKAELIADSSSLIEMEFEKKSTCVKLGKEKFELSTEGFWCPRIIIKQKGDVVALQKHFGLWGTKSAFELDGKTYNANLKQGMLFNISYSTEIEDILTYKLDTSKSKIQITFEVRKFDIPEKHLLLLLALGFYSIQNVALEAGADDFILSAVA
jgi:hypothetical protein